MIGKKVIPGSENPLSSLRRARIAAPLLLLTLVLPGSAPAKDTGPEFKLGLEFHHQEHSLSCEAAALAMVLSYYHVQVSEAGILAKMPFDKTPHRDGTWGDPGAGFVGDIDGTMPKTGYGIHWRALARLSSLWRRTEVMENARLSDLTENLSQHRPIIVWGYDTSDSGAKLKWRTREGREIRAIDGEHTRVVYGFKGDPKSPIGFFLMDPRSGPQFWKTDDFLKNWASFGRVGIVIYPESPQKAPQAALH